MSTEVLDRPGSSVDLAPRLEPPSPVEVIKKATRGLRGTLVESLADPLTGAIREADTQLIKFHGSYHAGRPRPARRARAPEARACLQLHDPHAPARRRVHAEAVAGAVASWRAPTARGTLRLTTRQAFQLHGVIKKDLKTTMQGMQRRAHRFHRRLRRRESQRDGRGQPGGEPAARRKCYDWAVKLSEHLKPKTRAYHEIWLDGEKLVGPGRRRADPRPALSAAQVQDRHRGAAAQRRRRVLAGPRLHRHPRRGRRRGSCWASTSRWAAASAPRMASRRPIRASRDVIGFLTPDQMLKVAETVVMIQRDFGDRTDRKHARLKYTIADRGVDWFKAELFKRLGYALEPARAVQVHHAGRSLRLAARARWPLAPDAAHRVRPRRRPSGRAASSPASRRSPPSTRAISASPPTRT